MSSVPDGRAANQPFSPMTFRPPMAAPLAGASVRIFTICSPASSVELTCARRERRELLLLRRRRRGLDAVRDRVTELARTARGRSPPGSRPRRAVISADSRAGTMPSLSVVHTLPFRRGNEAPALSSPPKHSEPSSRPCDEPLEAHRHLVECVPELGRDPIDQLRGHHRLAHRGRLRGHCGRCCSR